jgi:hypothetical protein
VSSPHNPCAPGERGGPQQHPWEAGLAFTAGFLGQTDTPITGADDEERQEEREDNGSSTGAGAAPGCAAAHDPMSPRTRSRGSGGGGAGGAATASPPPAAEGAAAAAAAAAAALEPPWHRGRAAPVAGPEALAAVAAAAAPRADGVRVHRRFLPFPQPYGLEPALLEVQLWLLGKLLAVVPAAAQAQVLEVRAGRWNACSPSG